MTSQTWILKQAETERQKMINLVQARVTAKRIGEVSPVAATSQVGGDHYTRLAVQPWAAMEAWMTPEQFRGFLIGNIIRYMARTKDDVKEDHRKAAHYLQKLIEVEAKQ